MNNIDEIIKLMNNNMGIFLEKYRLKDFIDHKNLTSDEFDFARPYFNMSIKQILEIFKIEKLYENKRIDDKERNDLRKKLDKYYNTKNIISEMVFNNIISDMDETIFLDRYYDSLDLLHKELDRYNIFIDFADVNLIDINKLGRKKGLRRIK